MEMRIYFKNKQTKKNWTQLQSIYLFMAAPCGIQDLSSRAGIEPSPPAVEAWSLIQWAAREVPWKSTFNWTIFFSSL